MALSQYDFTAPFEGAIPHMYLDSVGLVTAGVGFMIPNTDALKFYPWSPNLQEAQADFLILQDLRAEGIRSARYYRKHTHARLSDEAMRQIFANKVSDFRHNLQKDWNLNALPAPVQIALVDMAYNLGVGGLSKYRKLYEACIKRDWATAAKECRRSGPSEARNAETAAHFLGAV
jgi:GH24 family phage-related lysozyme (muramidase)